MAFFLLVILISMEIRHSFFMYFDFFMMIQVILHQIISKKNHRSQDQEILMIFIFQMERYSHVAFNYLFFYLKVMTLDAIPFQLRNLVQLFISLVHLIFQFGLVSEKYHLNFIVLHSIFQNIHLFNSFKYVIMKKLLNLYSKNLKFELLLLMRNFFDKLFNF